MEVGEQNQQHILLEVTDPSHAGAARRAAAHCAMQLGMGETDRGSIAIAVTEMATNVLKHAIHGKVILDVIGSDQAARGLRALAIDKGPGIRNMAAALEDGHSTAGSAGTGLGAIRRLSTCFDIYSYAGKGTCLLAEFWPHKKIPRRGNHIDVGVVSVPIRGEAVCGDGWACKCIPGWVLLMLVDGLGHGIYAAEAAREAERILEETTSKSPASILRDAHDALRKTRGAAVAIAAIDYESGRLTFSGLGNISATLLSQENYRCMPSHNGVAGHEIRSVQEFVFPWSKDNVLIMHSDGLIGRWRLGDYPGIWNKPASLMAALLYRDFSRERDDTTALVAKSF